jgi:hypothetical protein
MQPDPKLASLQNPRPMNVPLRIRHHFNDRFDRQPGVNLASTDSPKIVVL